MGLVWCSSFSIAHHCTLWIKLLFF